MIQTLEFLKIKDTSGDKLYREEDLRGRNAAANVQNIYCDIYNSFGRNEFRRKLRGLRPVKKGESQKPFWETVTNWITSLKKKNPDSRFLQDFNRTVLLQPGTAQSCKFLLHLSVLMLENVLRDKLEVAGNAVPLAVMKYSTKMNVVDSLKLQRKLVFLEAENVELERSKQKFLDSEFNLALACLKTEEDCEREFDDLDHLEKIHNDLRKINELIFTRVNQVKQYSDLQSQLHPVDLIGGLQMVTNFMGRFLSGYDSKTCEELTKNAEAASVYIESMKKAVKRMHEQRLLLEEMLKDVKQRAEQMIKNLNFDEDEADTELPTELQDTNPEERRVRQKIDVEELVAHLEEAYRRRYGCQDGK